MAYIRFSFYSHTMQMNVDVSVVFPNRTFLDDDKGFPYRYQPGVTYQTLWLFSGGSGDYSDWVRFAGVERYAERAQLIIISPRIEFGIDWSTGEKYYTYLTEELPDLIKFLFPVSDKRENNFVAGLSMGGYGAYRWAFNHPEKFACVGSFSSPVDVLEDLERGCNGNAHIVTAFGGVEGVKNTDKDILYLARKHRAASTVMPRMYQACGTEDFTYNWNKRARDVFRELGFDHTWVEAPGTHNWDFWAEIIPKYIAWLPLRNAPIYPKEAN
jgi:putative tributyrin esterase